MAGIVGNGDHRRERVEQGNREERAGEQERGVGLRGEQRWRG